MRIQEFDFSIDLLRVILWQYDKAEKIQGLLQNKQDAMNLNQTDFWDDWVADVFNINTLNDFGVTVWAIILDLPLLINVPIIDPDKIGFGFGGFRKNFTNGNFNINPSGASLLTLEQRRITLKMRYQYLSSRPTVPQQNIILNNAFGNLGLSYVADNRDMTMEYIFEFPIEPWIEFIFENFNVFPTPAGVEAILVEI